MFTTIPYYHRHQAQLEVIDSTGRVFTVGPVLPFFTPYDTSYHRYHTTFSRMRSKRYKRYMNAYMNNAKLSLEKELQITVTSLTLKLEYEKLRTLKEMRKDGEMTVEKNIDIGPYTWK